MSWYFNDFRADTEDWPSISLVTPSYNQAEYLGSTLQSVLDQGYPELEYIVMDGDSDDDSSAVIERYESDLDYWRSEPDHGMYDAINQGFERSTGEIMGWINSDDLHLPWTLHVVGAIFQAFPSVNWISTLNPGACDSAGVPTFKCKPGFAKRAFVQGRYGGGVRNIPGYGHIQQESTFWRRSLWEASDGLSLAYHGASDFDLWCQFYKLDRLYGVNVPLGVFRRHAAQKTSSTEYSYQAECEYVLESHFPSSQLTVQQAATYLRLHRSVFSSLLTPYFGYRGPRIDRSMSEGKWTLHEEYFL